jgi:hypothetical protein
MLQTRSTDFLISGGQNLALPLSPSRMKIVKKLAKAKCCWGQCVENSAKYIFKAHIPRPMKRRRKNFLMVVVVAVAKAFL